MKRYLALFVALIPLLFTTSAYAKTNEEIAQMCEALSSSIIGIAKVQTKEICISRLFQGASKVSDTSHYIMLDDREGAKSSINKAIEEIGMSELSGWSDLTSLHFAKASAYEIRNEIDAIDRTDNS